MKNKTQDSNIDKESTGFLAVSYLYQNKVKDKPVKKNGVPINLRINKTDLEIIDYLAEEFGVSRNWFISEMIEADIFQMFNAFEMKPKYQLAVEADQEISRNNMEHEYRGATWIWDVVGPDQDVFNPATEGIYE